MTPIDPGALFARAGASDDDAGAVIAELGHHVASAPDDFDAWLTLGLICAQRGRAEDAEEALARALSLRPSSLLARIAHARLMPPHVARRELDEAHAIAPDHFGILFELAIVEAQLRLLDDAIRHLRAARALAGTDADRARVVFALAPLARARAGVPRLLGASWESLLAWEALVGGSEDAPPEGRRPEERMVRGDGVLVLARLASLTDDAERTIEAIFAFVPTADAVGDAPLASAVPLVAFVAAALGIDAAAAGDLVRRLGEASVIDEGAARIAFATREVAPYGEAHGIAVTRLLT